MKRHTYLICLEITPTAPLTHGSGAEGNEQVLLRREMLVPAPDAPGGWRRLYVPQVSGPAFKAMLREHAVDGAVEALGLGPEHLNRDVIRLLLKGGKTTKGGQSVSLDEMRELRRLFPVLSVFGAMDGAFPLRGAFVMRGEGVRPFARELVDAGLMPRRLEPRATSLDGEDLHGDDYEPIVLHPGLEPVPLKLVTGSIQQYRHDMIASRTGARLLGAGRRAEIAEARDAVAKSERPTKEERRAANESMPYAYQCILPGTPMVAQVELRDVTEHEFAAFGDGLARWIRSGAHLGGGSTVGRGTCRVRVSGAIRYAAPSGVDAVPSGERVPVETADVAAERVLRRYYEYMGEVRPDVLAYLEKRAKDRGTS